MHPKKKNMRLWALVTLVMTSGFSSAYATKPCAANPCRNKDHTINHQACLAKADWVAIGGISNVVRDYRPKPLLKDFASFRFHIHQLVKGDQHTSVDYKVGWCRNSTPLPSDSSGLFIIYGAANKTADGKNTYLDLAPLDQVQGLSLKIE